MKNFQIQILIIFKFLLKTYIGGTRWNRLDEADEAVLTNTPIYVFEQK